MRCAACWSPDLSDLLIISQAWIEHQDGVSLHPDLLLWQEQLNGYRRCWFESSPRNPLAWYAALNDAAPATLLAAACSDLPGDIRQCWVATPYHAAVTRASVRVMPEGQFPWRASDAAELCGLLNPLLADEGIELFAVGAAILCGCREPIDAFPQGFGAISGRGLPDAHHEGADGGRLNRLLSEVQMYLFQHPLRDRHERGEPEVTGIWLWSPIACLVPESVALPAVATRNPALGSMVDGRDAGVIISEAERVGALLQAGAPLPHRILLAGSEYAVLLKRSLLSRLAGWSMAGRGSKGWQVQRPAPEAALLSQLRTL